MKKILHITTVNNLTNGQRQQLKSECNEAKSNRDVIWDVVVFHNGKKKEPFEYDYPFLFRGLFLRNMYCWLYMLVNYKKYDFILQRHMTFDVFSFLFARLIPNRITIHHAKEVEELRNIKKDWRGRLASKLEKITGPISLNSVVAVIGVTREIALYQNDRLKNDIDYYVYPNGIDVESIDLLGDERKSSINIAFVCGSFNAWHGLEKLMTVVCENSQSNYMITIHLIGKLSNIQKNLMDNVRNKKIKFINHGYLEQDEYVRVLRVCDIGLGSLAMETQNLYEGSTLKVREYLAMGLPVFATHKDSSLPTGFVYFNCSELSIESIIDFSIKMKSHTRESVRGVAKKYINKSSVFVDLVRYLNDKIK